LFVWCNTVAMEKHCFTLYAAVLHRDDCIATAKVVRTLWIRRDVTLERLQTVRTVLFEALTTEQRCQAFS